MSDDRITKAVLPNSGQEVHFVDREHMRSDRPPSLMQAAKNWPAATLPIDWYHQITFPNYANFRYGTCGLEMAAHGDQTFTGQYGERSKFDLDRFVAQYFNVSGGDRGLTENQVINQIWKVGIAGDPSAIIYDAIDVNPDPASIASAVRNFGVVCLAISTPNAWIAQFNPNGGAIWDAAYPNPRNGHYVLINGVDQFGRFRVQTWGSWAWLTPAGLASADPDTFTVFSPRWFNPATGMDPTGATYRQKADLWASLGGRPLPPAPFPDPAPKPAAGPTYQTLRVGEYNLTLWLEGSAPPPGAGKNPASIQLGDQRIRLTASKGK